MAYIRLKSIVRLSNNRPDFFVIREREITVGSACKTNARCVKGEKTRNKVFLKMSWLEENSLCYDM